MTFVVPTTIMTNGSADRTFEHPATFEEFRGPLVSCLMASRGHRFPAAFAIECYRRQTYRARELVIVTTQLDSPLSKLVYELNDPSISLFEVDAPTLGELRNASVAHARGAIVCHWDDDDLSHPDRLSVQVAALMVSEARASFLDRIMLWWPERACLNLSASRMWEGTMTAYRDAVPVYPALPREEDLYVAKAIANLHPVARSEMPEGYCYVIHGGNTNAPEHFEAMLPHSAPLWGEMDYASALARLSLHLPVDRYETTGSLR